MIMNNQDQPLVTICVPVYNGEKYLHECLNSILLQTYSNWECVVNNNCSTDKSLEIAQNFSDRDSRFKIFSNDTFISVVPNWNKVFSHTNTNAKYLKMVQADDWIFPEYIDSMVKLFETDPQIGICSAYRIDSINVLPINFNIYDGKVFSGNEILYKHLSHQLDIVGSITTVMYSMQYLSRLERYPYIFDETKYHVDTELDYEIMYMSKVGFVPQILSYTRRHKESGTSTIVHKFGTLYQHYEYVLSKYLDVHEDIPKLYKNARLDYAYFHLKCLIFNKKRILEWHRKYFKGSFTTLEYFLAFLSRNIVFWLIAKNLIKLKRI
jgi:glycosyltransferase involved in cell wall biosynthesis